MLNISKEVKAKLRIMSKKLNMPMSQCVNMLVTKWLQNCPVEYNTQVSDWVIEELKKIEENKV
jgi:antitoxin component of RelBE/YafQ-DinJ toxin-antitoxin module